jgi:hypothetical protein
MFVLLVTYRTKLPKSVWFFRVPVSFVIEIREVIEAGGRVGVFLPEHPFPDLEGLLVERFGLVSADLKIESHQVI